MRSPPRVRTAFSVVAYVVALDLAATLHGSMVTWLFVAWSDVSDLVAAATEPVLLGHSYVWPNVDAHWGELFPLMLLLPFVWVITIGIAAATFVRMVMLPIVPALRDGCGATALRRSTVRTRCDSAEPAGYQATRRDPATRPAGSASRRAKP